MKTSLLVLAMVVMFNAVAFAELPNSTTGTKLFDLQKEASRLLRTEALAQDFASREAALVELAELHQAMTHDERFETSASLRSLQTRIRSRLRHVVKDLESTSSASPSTSANPDAGALGGRVREAGNADALIELIQATIAPQQWDVNGGESTIRYFAPKQVLVIRAPSRVHSSVGNVLGNLRRP